MQLNTLGAVFFGKLIFFLSRTFKLGGGHAAPGLYALNIDPDLVENLINKSAKNIIITGTNGKTTTSKIIADILKSAGFKVLRNSTGSNLERGIASTLIKASSLTGKVTYDFAVWECDEFAFNLIAPKIKPDIIVFLNVFRDQLDRYGEVDKIVTRWNQTLLKLKNDPLIISNSDDGKLENLTRSQGSRSITFGVKNSKIFGESRAKSSKKPIYEAEIINNKNLSSTEFKINFGDDEETFRIPLPGVFNVYNFLASFALAQSLHIPLDAINVSLKDFSPAFGRFERFQIPGKDSSSQASIFLIKNPVGASQTIQTISPHIHFGDTILLALNDNLADGTDVSWIWDADFEELAEAKTKAKILVSGTRCYDLALRLKYAGIGETNIEIIPDTTIALKKALETTQLKLFILPTYTAMLEIQKQLTQQGIKKEYWKE